MDQGMAVADSFADGEMAAAPAPVSPPPAPTIGAVLFADAAAFREYLRTRIGADAPFFAPPQSPEAAGGNARGYFRRVIRAFLHPASSDRALFIALARKSRALAIAAAAPSTVRAMLDLSEAHANAFRAARVDMTAIRALAKRQAALEAAAAASSKGGNNTGEEEEQSVAAAVLPSLTRADVNTLGNIVFRLRAASEDTEVSTHFAAVKRAEADLQAFRTRVASTPAGAEWLRAPFVAERMRAAREAFKAESSNNAAATTASAEDGAAEARPSTPKLASPKPQVEPTPFGMVPKAPVVVSIPPPTQGERKSTPPRLPAQLRPVIPPAPSVEKATSAASAVTATPAGLGDVSKAARVEASRAEQDANGTRISPPRSPTTLPDAKAAEFEANHERVVEYVDLALATKRTKREWETACPVRRAADQAAALQKRVHGAFDIAAAEAEEKKANSVKNTAGATGGKRVEAALFNEGLPAVRLALAAVVPPGTVTPTTPIVSVTDVATMNESSARFVRFANVVVKGSGRTIGELDGVVLDRATQKVALVLEAKKAAADLPFARAQRVKFVTALRGALADGGKTVLGFNIKGPDAAPYAALVAAGQAPALTPAVFALLVAEPQKRWVLATRAEPALDDAPVPSRLSFHLARELATALALAGWVPRSGDGQHHTSQAIDEACAALDRAPDPALDVIVDAVAGAWRKAAAGNAEVLYGLPRLEAELCRAVRPAPDGFANSAAAGGHDAQVACPPCAWIPIDFGPSSAAAAASPAA